MTGPGARPCRPPSLGAPGVALAGMIIALLAGGWLMLAPFALGYQPAGQGWTDATKTGFFTGLGLASLAVLGMLAAVAVLASRLRALGPAPRQPRRVRPRPAAAPATPAAAPDELTGLLRSLVQALNREPGPLPASGDGGPPGPPRQAQPPPGQAQARPGQGGST